MSFLEVRHVQKIYTTRFGGTKVRALSDVNFTVEKGEYVAIMGESGSGKTTLLNILAALDKPTGGEVVLDGRALGTIPEREIAARLCVSGVQPARHVLRAGQHLPAARARRQGVSGDGRAPRAHRPAARHRGAAAEVPV